MSGLRSTTHYTYTSNNNHSNEFGRNYSSMCKYIALKCILKYIILIKKKDYAHTIKALVICNLLMVNTCNYRYKINTYNLHTLMSAIIPPT